MESRIEARIQPSNPELLYLQAGGKHRSCGVFANVNMNFLDINRRDLKFLKHVRGHPIPDAVFDVLDAAGFGGVFRCGWKQVDHIIITALVERWQTETHTFHFPTGEASVTLEDVQVLYGLPVDGSAVTGTWISLEREYWVGVCAQQLGFTPPLNKIDYSALSFPYLVEMLDRQAHVNNQL